MLEVGIVVAFIIITLLAALTAFIVDQVFFGFAPADPQCTALGRRQQALVAAVADTLFPPGGSITLSGQQAGLVRYFDQSYSELPRDKRVLLALLFVFTEYAPWIFGPKRGRFTRLGQADREAVMNAMATSSIYFRRICFLSLRGVLCMGYLANQDVARQIGAVSNNDPFTPSTFPRAA